MYLATNSIVLTLSVYIALCKYINYTNYHLHYLLRWNVTYVHK